MFVFSSLFVGYDESNNQLNLMNNSFEGHSGNGSSNQSNSTPFVTIVSPGNIVHGMTITFNYSVTNYSGNYVNWNSTIQGQANSTTYQWSSNLNSQTNGTNGSNINSTSRTYSIDGNYTVCAWLYSYPNSSDCVSFQLIIPPANLSIISPSNNSVISNVSSGYSDYLQINYIASNSNGYVYWTSTETNSQTNNSSITWSSYPSYSSTTYRVGYNNRTICASVYGVSSSATDCINIEIQPRVAVINNLSASLSNNGLVYIEYQIENYSSGTLTIGNLTIDQFYYGNSSSSNNSNSSTNSSSSSYSISLNSGYLNYGNNSICVNLNSEDNKVVSECRIIFIPPPTYRMNIISPASNFQYTGNSISIGYITENYSGYVSWTVNSTNGTSTSYSYGSPYTRTNSLQINQFGSVDICATFSVGSSNYTDCVTINHVARTLVGQINTPSNNSQVSGGYLYLNILANNYSSGIISINGVVQNYLGASFYQNSSGNQSGNINGSGNQSSNNNSNYHMNLPYGSSTICLNLIGENNQQLIDCINLTRVAPTHIAEITSPSNNSNHIGNNLNFDFTVTNSLNYYFLLDGSQTNYHQNYNNSTGYKMTILFGQHELCLISKDLTNQNYSDCITVTMIDPNVDSDNDGLPDHSDQCPNTNQNTSIDVAGCAQHQLDSDSDGIMNDQDLCPNTTIQTIVDSNGCSAVQRDSDSDGIVDAYDLCVNSPPLIAVNSDGCSTSQLDSDNDGIMDDLDLCPNTIVGSQVNNGGCAASQLDSDSDGIVDSFDQCQNTPIGSVVDQTGCIVGTSNTGNNTGSGTGNNTGSGSSSGESSSEGMPGFEALYLIISLMIAVVYFQKQK
jgi:hypothetical protein